MRGKAGVVYPCIIGPFFFYLKIQNLLTKDIVGLDVICQSHIAKIFSTNILFLFWFVLSKVECCVGN